MSLIPEIQSLVNSVRTALSGEFTSDRVVERLDYHRCPTFHVDGRVEVSIDTLRVRVKMAENSSTGVRTPHGIRARYFGQRIAPSCKFDPKAFLDALRVMLEAVVKAEAAYQELRGEYYRSLEFQKVELGDLEGVIHHNITRSRKHPVGEGLYEIQLCLRDLPVATTIKFLQLIKDEGLVRTGGETKLSK